jgi:outer membrane protein assembly factor BamB
VSYGELTGKPLATQASLLGDWFSAGALAFTVATTSNHKTTILAYDSSGKKTWSRAVGPLMDPRGWAHAATGQDVYVAMLKPYEGLEALDPTNGSVVWQAKLKGIQRLAVANGVVFALTNELGLPLKLVMYRADTGKAIGSLSLSSGYYAFPTNNELMVADGMVFARVVGPGGPTLVALGL